MLNPDFQPFSFTTESIKATATIDGGLMLRSRSQILFPIATGAHSMIVFPLYFMDITATQSKL
jgi:hypothetical protein